MECTLLCPTGRPCTPFTLTIQPIERRHSAAARIFYMALVSKLLSGRFSYASGVRAPLALVVVVVVVANVPTVHQDDECDKCWP